MASDAEMDVVRKRSAQIEDALNALRLPHDDLSVAALLLVLGGTFRAHGYSYERLMHCMAAAMADDMAEAMRMRGGS